MINESCSAPTTSEDQVPFLFAQDSGAGSEEGGGYGVEEPVQLTIPCRSGSKRARAAEVHNLTEKRRRSRINEKMKALQTLIPNSAKKTDKASMLDEAIEYLKQLQLQVQMLSMRHGLTGHAMYLPGALQPLQASNQSISFGENTLTMNTDVLGMLPLNPDSSSLNSLDLTSQCTPSHQTVLLPTADISPLESSQAHDRSFQEIFREGMGSQQRLD